MTWLCTWYVHELASCLILHSLNCYFQGFFIIKLIFKKCIPFYGLYKQMEREKSHTHSIMITSVTKYIAIPKNFVGQQPITAKYLFELKGHSLYLFVHWSASFQNRKVKTSGKYQKIEGHTHNICVTSVTCIFYFPLWKNTKTWNGCTGLLVRPKINK